MSSDTPFRILVVDDEPELAEIIAVRLRKTGFDVHTATTVMGACQLIQLMHLNLVITDIRMDGGGGWDVAEFVRGRDNRPEIIMFSAHADIDPAQAAKYGVRGFLGKPVNFPLLVNMIRTIQEGKDLQAAKNAPLPELPESARDLYNPEDFQSMGLDTSVRRLMTGAVSPNVSRLIEFSETQVIIESDPSEISAGEEIECTLKTSGPGAPNETTVLRSRVLEVQDAPNGRLLLTLEIDPRHVSGLANVQRKFAERQSEIEEFMKTVKGR